MYVNTSKDKDARDLAAYLDGKFVDGCLEADTDKGYVIRLKRDEEDRFYIEENGEAARERLEGKVELFIGRHRVKMATEYLEFLKDKYNLPIEGERTERV